MRGGICSVQQALTQEAANLVKQAISLARRRGHAQVTPLHVASAMLASSTGLLRRACLQSHSHPLQCKALELCFNVALNRLPASTCSALLGPHNSYPSLSNALIAAFKRAQAHQRKGSVENQQQPVLALKIEVEQMVISILDDPSVSRVMREAGFSSPQVKHKVEQAVSLEIGPQSSSTTITKANSTSQSSISLSPFGVTKPINRLSNINDDDVTSVLNTLVTKKRNMVIVGECVDSSESVVRGVMHKIERANAPSELNSVKFLSLPLLSLLNVSKEEVEQKLMELRCIVKSYISRGVILYLGDLKWVAEYWSNYSEQKVSYYCSLEHVIMELNRLVRGFGEHGRFWLLGIAAFSSYIKCKTGHPSLEVIWELNALTIPVDSLDLSLTLDSSSQSKTRSKGSMFGSNWSLLNSGVDKSFNCCTEYSVSASSSLPSWLQKCKQEIKRDAFDEDNKECLKISDLCMNWNSVCDSRPKEPEKSIGVAASPTSSISISSHEHTNKSRNKIKPELLSNPNSSPNSASSSESLDDMEELKSFRECTSENLKILCDALEKKVPQRRDIIPEIATTILECRTGTSTNKHNVNGREDKEETWLFFMGADAESKGKIAREIARLIFGSQSNYVVIPMSKLSSTTKSTHDSTEESNNKRTRDEMGCGYYERFCLALNENPHRVFFMEDMDQVDKNSLMGIKKSIKTGIIKLPCGEIIPLKDSIVIFSSENCVSSSSRECTCAPRIPHKCIEEDRMQGKNVLAASLDLNISLGHDHNIIHDHQCELGILEFVDSAVTFKIQELQ